MELLIQRLWQAPDKANYRATTTGVISIDGIQSSFSLEPTALMIPSGIYSLQLCDSERFSRKTPRILDVPGRTAIEIHGGNVATDSEGCVLCAEKRIDEYHIYESKPATDAIEEALSQAEANNEKNTVQIMDVGQLSQPNSVDVDAHIGG